MHKIDDTGKVTPPGNPDERPTDVRAESSGRLAYQKPEIVVWGNVVEETAGLTSMGATSTVG
jgi:hypothetical protein